MQEKVVKGKVVDYGIGETQKGAPQILILAEFEENGEKFTERWYGSLKEGKAREITLKTLIDVLGFSAGDLTVLSDGPQSGALNIDREYDFTIADELDQNGKARRKVKWINHPGGAAFAKKLDRNSAAAKLSSINVKGDVMRMQQEAAKANPVPNHAPQTAQNNDPF